MVHEPGGRKEIRWQLVREDGSREVFLRMGKETVVFEGRGKEPEEKDRLCQGLEGSG